MESPTIRRHHIAALEGVTEDDFSDVVESSKDC
jgi:hypothetical protein